MVDLHRLDEAIKLIKTTLYQEEQNKKSLSASLAEKAIQGAQKVKPALFSLKRELQSKIFKYLKACPDLITSEPGISDIFGLLATEEEYTRCLAWILSAENTETFGPRLIIKILARTYPEYNESIVSDILDQNFRVSSEHWTDMGQLDILIQSTDSNKFIILIENKILPGTREGVEIISAENKKQFFGQLQRYEKWAKRQHCEHMFLIFLCQNLDQMLSYDTAFRSIRWRDLLVEVQLLRSQVITHSPFTTMILDLFIRDVERFTSPLKSYFDILRKIRAISDENEDSGISIKILRQITDLIEMEEPYVETK